MTRHLSLIRECCSDQDPARGSDTPKAYRFLLDGLSRTDTILVEYPNI